MLGLSALLLAAAAVGPLWDAAIARSRDRTDAMILECTLSCPVCGHLKREVMSYGDAPCPPAQEAGPGCCG